MTFVVALFPDQVTGSAGSFELSSVYVTRDKALGSRAPVCTDENGRQWNSRAWAQLPPEATLALLEPRPLVLLVC